jgi:hypothetical protein
MYNYILSNYIHIMCTHINNIKNQEFGDKEASRTTRGAIFRDANSSSWLPITDSILSTNPKKKKGCWISPYSLPLFIRYIINYLTNGRFSYINPDHHKMKLLGKEGNINLGNVMGAQISSIKVLFLGDIMMSRSGKPPRMGRDVQKLLRNADVIVANVESPVIESNISKKRGLSLKFEMSSSYIAMIHSCNHKAQWIFNIANNHACDNSGRYDMQGVVQTAKSIKSAIPSAQVMGAMVPFSKPFLSLTLYNGAKMGIVGWTELMNHDGDHYQKPIVRERDISLKAISKLKQDHSILIGFPHGNEEQSYHPIKETRDRWISLMGKEKFDVIVGHGPHVLHPAELVDDRGLLFHSIGNFCSPIGKSQTKVGAIPEIDLTFKDRTVGALKYRIHFLQQNKEGLSLIAKLHEKSTFYPEIIRRLRRIWTTLFIE